MGIFDNLLAPFNTTSQDQAATAQQQSLVAAQNALDPQLASGRAALTNSLANSTNAWNTALGNATGAANTSLANSVGAWNPIAAAGNTGLQAYLNATGANGPAGNAAAVNNFQAGPGYQFTMDQMLQNLARQQQMQGQGNSGATDVNTLQQASGIANQGWQQYIQNLAPFLNLAPTAASGITGANQNTAGLLTNANLATGQGLNTANINAGNQLAGNYATQGAAGYGTNVGIGNAQANADLASLTAGKNLWGLGLNAAEAAAGAPISGGFLGSQGGGGQGGNQGGGLFSSLAGYFNPMNLAGKNVTG